MSTCCPAPQHRNTTLVVVGAALVAAALVALVPGVAHAADPLHGQQWALDVIGADQGHAIGQGQGMTIAIVDSGVDLAHEDLVANLVGGIDLVDPGTPPQDEFGHGTHVAGIAAAERDNGRGIVGVAPRARIMPVRVLDEDGTGSSSDVSQGVRWAVDNGADVVNLSLGEAAQQVFGSSLVDAIEYAWGRGVVVVVAAGNEFVLSSGFRDEPAVVVSATTRSDRAPDYSNGVGSARWGMAAPGGGCQLLTCPREDDVLSTYWQNGSSDVYAYLSGTSMAAPHVAAAAAVLRSLGLSPQQTVDRLLATAEDLGPAGRDSTYGAGRLDLAGATAGLAAGGATGAGSGDQAAPDGQDDASTGESAPSKATPRAPASSPPAPRSSPPAANPPAPDTAGPSAQASPSAPATPGTAAADAGPTPDELAAPAPLPSPSARPPAAVAPSPGTGPLGVVAAALVATALAAFGAALWVHRRGPS